MRGFKLISKRFLTRFVAMVVAMAMIICSVPVTAQAATVSYAIKSDSFTVDDFTVSYTETSQWSNYCVADVNITNNSDETYNTWTLCFDYNGTIDNIWNADIIGSENGRYTLLCKDYNSQIAPGQTVNIGFMAYGEDASPDLPENVKVLTDDEADDSTSDDINSGNSGSDNTVEDNTPTIGNDSGVPEGLKALNYTIFSGCDSKHDFYTNNTCIIGSVHTNGDFYYQGTSFKVDGVLEACDTIELNTSSETENCQVASKAEGVEYIGMPSLTNELKSYAQSNGEIYNESTFFPEDKVSIYNPIYIKGDATFNTTDFEGTGIVYAENSVVYNVGSLETTGNARLFLVSENNDITLNGSDITINGVLYAPNGRVTINANNVNIKGRIIAQDITVNATNFNIEGTPHDFDSLDFVFEPEFDMVIEGNQKINRKVTISLVGDDLYTSYISDDVKWEIKSLSQNEDRETESYYAVDDTVSSGFYKELLFYYPGTYDVTATVSNGTSEYTITKQLVIVDDYAPTAALKLSDYYVLRDENQIACIDIYDISSSPDGDELDDAIISIYYDSNNDGTYSEDELVVEPDLSIKDGELSTTGRGIYEFKTSQVGKYKIVLTVCEKYDDTIPALLKSDAYRWDDTLEMAEEYCVFEVGNQAPEASVDITKAKAVDIVVAVSEADGDKVSSYCDKLTELEDKLTDMGYDVRLELAETSSLTAQDTFAWTEYDHENFDVYPDHILYEDESIKMLGYTRQPYKDFLYVNESEPGYRVFEFDMQRDRTDWHSMEGGGFLFNTYINEDEDIIDGYCMLIVSGSVMVIKLNQRPLSEFLDGVGGYGTIYRDSDVIARIPIDTEYEKHNFKLYIDEDSITICMDDEIILDNCKLSTDIAGYGYGPIVSHARHGCSQRSYFTFSNITMRTTSGVSLSDVIDGYEWRQDASRYVINISEEEVLEFKTDELTAQSTSSLIENDITFIGIGNEEIINQYNRVINVAGLPGLVYDINDIENSANAVCDYITNNLESKDYTVKQFINTEDRICYGNYYKDPENDPIYNASWEYEYDPAVFEGQGGTVEHIVTNYDEPLTFFENAGAYVIRLMVQDNPVGENESLQEYRLWSDTASNEKLILVNQRPVAQVNVTVSEDINDDSMCVATVDYEAYDNDHPSDESKGIRQEYKWYKNINDAQWTEGVLPGKLKVGDTYLVKYQVMDVEGELSNIDIYVVTTSQLIKYTPLKDVLPPEITLNVSKTEASILDIINIEAYADDDYGLDVFELYINDELISEGYINYSYITTKAGVDNVKAYARDMSGNEAVVEIPITVVNDLDLVPPTAQITYPNGSIEDTDMYITGTATDDMAFDRYTITLREEGEEEYTTVKESKQPVVDGLLGRVNLTGYEPGRYEIMLNVWDKQGNKSSTGYICKIVQYEYEIPDSGQTDGGDGFDSDGTKPAFDPAELEIMDEPAIGVMNIGFADMTANIGGLNMTVNRMYDSRNKKSGDFGYGWTMDLQGLKLYELGDITTGYSQEQTGSVYSTGYQLVETEEHDIVITYGDGSYDRFELVMTPSRQALVPLQETKLSYNCVTNPNISLEILCDTSAIIDGSSLGFYDDSMYDTLSYKLTTQTGVELYIRGDIGLYKIVDTSGNVVTVDKNGYHSTDGKSITLTRDEKGRITKATDPAGNSVTYEYDEKGDLIRVTDQALRQVSFTYDDNHNLLSIIDPMGIAIAHNEYDQDGRLIAIIDAEGNRVEYDHDIEGRTETVRDRLGNTTVYVYDERGNVLSTTDPYGNKVVNTYDEQDNLLTTTDALGNTTTHTYDTLGNLTQTVAPDGTSINLTYTQDTLVSGINDSNGKSMLKVGYDDKGRLTTLTDANNNAIVYSYTDDGKLVGLADSIGQIQKITYDSDGNIASTTNGEGESAYYTYDESGRVLSINIRRMEDGDELSFTSYYSYNSAGEVVSTVDNAGNAVHYEYDSNGNNTAVVDSKGRRFTYEYDTRGNMIRANYPDGTFEAFEYDANDNNITATSRSGLTTEVSYDKLNRPVKTSYADGTYESYEYDANGNVISVTDYAGATTTYEYDSCGRNTSIIDALGNKTVFTYDSYGKLTKTTDANDDYVEYSYDANGNVTKIRYENMYIESAEYDARNRMTTRTDGRGYKTSYEYDDADRLIKVTDPYGNSYSYEYDANSNLRTVTDPENHVTSYEYDEVGRVIKITNPLGKSMDYTYDECGNLTSSSDYMGTVTYYTYDQMDRLVEKKVGEEVTTYTYDDIGLLLSVTNKNGTVSYSYDEYNRLTSKTDERGITISYAYDSLGRYTGINNGFQDVTYEYDIMGRLISVTDGNGDKTTYEYNNVGDLSLVTYPSGIKIAYEYKANHRLYKEYVYGIDGKVDYLYDYSAHDSNGNRIKVVETDYTTGNKYEITYTYDKLNRLTKETIRCGDASLVNEYSYDVLSNRTSKTTTVTGDISLIADRDNDQVEIVEGTTTYTYNALNQLVTESRPEGDIIYTYDDNGSLVKVSGLKTADYSYDLERHLIRATIQEGNSVTVESYTYDYNGIRTSKTVNEVNTTYYVVDTSGELSQVVAETDADGNMTASYVRGHDLISVEQSDSKSYYISDGRGSVRHLLDEEGNVTDSYSYDAYGMLLIKDGETDNSYMYVGEEYNANTGLYYLRARYMNPSTGSFTTMDSYQGNLYEPISLHKYAYANANPVTYVDPSGYSYTLPGLSASMTMSQILSASISFIKVNTLIGGLVGALVGGIDSALGGNDLGQIWKDALKGFGTGLSLGLLISTMMCFAVKYPIIVAALHIFRGACLVMSGVGVYISLEEGNVAQAIFRGILALFAYKSAGKQIEGVKLMRMKAAEVQVGSDNNTYYHVTTAENAAKIKETGKLQSGKWEARVFAWRQQPTQKQASLAGISSKSRTVIKFKTNASFEADFGNEDIIAIRDITVQTTDGQRLPISISDVEIVGFKKVWWEFWKE